MRCHTVAIKELRRETETQISAADGHPERHAVENQLALETQAAVALDEARAESQDEGAWDPKRAERTNGTPRHPKTTILLSCTATGKLVSLVRKYLYLWNKILVPEHLALDPANAFVRPASSGGPAPSPEKCCARS